MSTDKPVCDFCKTNNLVYLDEDSYCCQRCGAIYDNDADTWTKHCSKCGKQVDELVGLFVPHLCRPCKKAIVDDELRRGHICAICRSARSCCCC